MSRTSFAVRFKAMIGIAPLACLARLRTRLVAHALRNGVVPRGKFAWSLGDESESAFSSTFKRAFGVSPRRHRGWTMSLNSD